MRSSKRVEPVLLPDVQNVFGRFWRSEDSGRRWTLRCGYLAAEVEEPWWSTTSTWTALSVRALTDGRALTNAGDDLGQITVWGQVNGDRTVLDDSDVNVDLVRLTVRIQA